MIVYGPVNREEASQRSGKKQQRRFAEKVMVWLEEVAFLVLFEKRHSRSSSLHQRTTLCCSMIQKQ